MAQQLLSTCGLIGTDQQPFPAVTFIKQNCGTDGSFLVATILGQRLKPAPGSLNNRDHRVLLIASHHSYSHYSSACLKLTYNLGPARECGQLQVIDTGSELLQNYPRLEPTLEQLQARIFAFMDESPKSTVILDDVSLFLNLGHSENQLIDLVEALVEKQTPEQQLVIKLNTADLYKVLCANLDDLAQTELQLEPLASGNFREVDGRLSIHRYPGKNHDRLFFVKQLDRSVLYKVNDRNVKLFAPGELGIKHL
ncbi:uncharacterized protein LOC129740014 [Uranotaenia lowii]|uniref:uncharacterized protein LOC129740014 n=1 Tax=Uranotaenia lowii TaxID=190385 RepID=UPI0024791E72|nr:uncharacterized protein LOC129740014 [Uranotaenia lowii]